MSIHDDMLEYNFRNKKAVYYSAGSQSEPVGTFVKETLIFKNVPFVNTNNQKTVLVGKITPTINGEFSISVLVNNLSREYDIKDKNGVSVLDGVYVRMSALNEYFIYTRGEDNYTTDVKITLSFRVVEATNYIIKG